MQPRTWPLADLSATRSLGTALARALPRGTVVELNGPLGAGKTALVQAIVASLGGDVAEVTSPTFVLVHSYLLGVGRTVFHLDAYRIRDDDEFLELGPEEMFEQGALTLIEWGRRVERCLPPERLVVELSPTGPQSRLATLTAHGQRLEQLLATIEPLEPDDTAPTP